jgi:hypothetical protein
MAVNILNKEGKKDMFKSFPHLRSLDDGTNFVFFKSYVPNLDMIQFTIYYQEPGKARKRLDAEMIDSSKKEKAKNIRIVAIADAGGNL